MLNYWLDSIDKEIDRNNDEPIPVIIVGNKIDLDILREITTSQGKKMSQENLVYGFLETSAKDGTNVDSAFWQLAKACCEIYNPKLMDAYLKPDEKKDKYEKKAEEEEKKEIEDAVKRKKKRRRFRARVKSVVPKGIIRLHKSNKKRMSHFKENNCVIL